MKKKISLRVLSVILTVIMIFTMVPPTVTAADGDCTHPSITEDNKCTECNADIVAKTVEYNQTEATYYTDFDAALAVASTEEHQACTLSTLVDLYDPIELSQGNFYFDPNGHTIHSTITLRQHAILRIKDGHGTFLGTLYGYDYSWYYVSGGIYGDVTRDEDDEYLMVQMNGHANFVAESTIVCLGTIEANESSAIDLRDGRYTGKLISNTGYDGFILRNVNIYSKMIANGKDMYGDPCGFRLIGGTYYDRCSMTVSDGAMIEASGYINIQEPVKINVYDNNNSGTVFYVNNATLNCPVNIHGGTLEADYKSAKFNGEVTIADGAKASLSGGSFAKLTVEGEKACADALVKYYIYRNSADKSLVTDAKVKTLENVYVEKCSEHTFDDNHICTICGAIADVIVIDADGNVTAFETFGDAMENAQTLTGTVTVKLLDDSVINSSSSVMSGDEIILDMNGKRIDRNFSDTSGNLPGIITTKKLTVTGNGSSSVFFGVLAYGDDVGELTIENGTYDARVAAMGPAKLTINDGTFNDYLGIDDYNGMPTVELNGGTYKYLASALEDYDWYSALGEGKGYEVSLGDVEFYEYQLNDNTAYGFDGAETGYERTISVVDHSEHTKINSDNRCEYCGADIVASTTNLNTNKTGYYETFEEAVDATKYVFDKTAIKLYANAKLTSTTVLSVIDTVIDLNGKTIGTDNSDVVLQLMEGKISIIGNGTFDLPVSAIGYAQNTKITIENGIFNKEFYDGNLDVTVNGGTFNEKVSLGRNGKLTINDGNFKKIAVANGITFNGGTYTLMYSYDLTDFTPLLGYGKEFKADVTGDIFQSYSGDDYLGNYYGFDGRADGKTVSVISNHTKHTEIDENNKCTECGADMAASASLKDGSSLGYYESLEKAFDAASALSGESVIKLLADADIKSSVELDDKDKNITIDLNGKEINDLYSNGSNISVKIGTLTITGNGTVNTRVSAWDMGGGNKTKMLIIENGTFNNYVSVYEVGIAINGGKFNDYVSIDGYQSTEIAGGYFKELYLASAENTKLNGGTFEKLYSSNIENFYPLLGENKGYYTDVGLPFVFDYFAETDEDSNENYYYGFNGFGYNNNKLSVEDHTDHIYNGIGLCLACGNINSEVHTHSYSEFVSADHSTHTYYCNICKLNFTEAHDYDMLGKCFCEETYLNGYFKMEAVFEGEVLGFFYHGMNEPMLDKGPAIPVKYRAQKYRVGYDSVLTLADDIGEIASGDTVRYDVSFVLSDYASQTFNVTVKDSASTVVNSYPFEGMATVKAKSDGFVCWKDQYGNIISTYKTYRFYVVKDVTLTACYDSESAAEIKDNKAFVTTNFAMTGDDDSITFFSERCVDYKQYKILSYGMLVIPESAVTNDESALYSDLICGSGNSNVIAYDKPVPEGQSTAKCYGQFTVAIPATYIEMHDLYIESFYARAYILVENADGGIEYHYGDVAKYAFEESDNRVFSRLDNPGKINDNSLVETVA